MKFNKSRKQISFKKIAIINILYFFITKFEFYKNNNNKFVIFLI